VDVLVVVPHPEQVPHSRVSSGTKGCAGCARLVLLQGFLLGPGLGDDCQEIPPGPFLYPTSVLYHYCIYFASFLRYNLPTSRLSVMEVNVGRLKELRKLRALSQEELAEAAEIGRATLSRIERGETGAHGRTLRKLAGALGVGVEELVKAEE
jgi:DNA-binding XRE family transcriptional regulator